MEQLRHRHGKGEDASVLEQLAASRDAFLGYLRRHTPTPSPTPPPTLPA